MKRLPLKQRWFIFLLWGMMGLLSSLLMAGIALGQSQPAVSTGSPPRIPVVNRAVATYSDPNTGETFNTSSSQIGQTQLIDPLGQVLDCSGNEFADYTGFRMTLFEQASPLGTLGPIVSLTRTTIANGLPPNINNLNPYDITNEAVNGRRGLYNFLLDPARGQTVPGTAYVLVITTPPNLGLSERRIRIVIGTVANNRLSYTATALDGQPIGIDGRTSLVDSVSVTDAAIIPLTLPVGIVLCQAQPLRITKTSDRAQAEPGDTALFRISVQNLSSAPVTNPVITDNLPLGFEFVNGSARAAIGNTQVPVTTTVNGRTLTFTVGATLPPTDQNQQLNLVYGVQITPDAVRGDGRNRAIIQGLINNQTVRDGPAIFRMVVRAGILSDCGTIIGKVFEDRNFDGEQQEGERGIPNAVIFMDDGNRIQADNRGMYSVQCVKPGPRTLVLDLSSVPGFQIAPNNFILERNTPSRLVRLSPGGMGRANFAVIPYTPEGGQNR